MTATVQDTGPLDWRIGIVDKAGRPTPEFQRRWASQRNNNALINTITFGSGAPSGTPADGAEYIDTSTDPFTIYFGDNSSWNKSSVTEFTELSDVPHSYVADSILRANSGATGLELVTPLALTDNPTATGSDSVVDGTASTFMRSDASPAIQKASSSQFGLVKVDGSTITSTGGVISSTGGGGGGPSGTYWSPENLGSGLTTDFTGLILSARNGGGDSTVSWMSGLATVPKSSGKFYVEFLVGNVNVSGGNFSGEVGLADSTYDRMGTFLGNDATSWGYLYGGLNSLIFNNGGSGGTVVGHTVIAGDIIGMAVDFTATTGSINWYVNNTLDGSVTGLTLGTSSVGAGFNISRGGGYLTLHATAASQTYSPPTGYTSWG